MSGPRTLLPAAATPLLLMLALDAFAGQKVVYVRSGGFDPETQVLNLGDHVVWSWNTNGSHTVTSGSGPTDPVHGTIFDSRLMGTNVQAYTWRADRVGTIPFYCAAHFGSGMVGALEVVDAGVEVASFRITEVQYDEGLGRDRIEIANLGAALGDLGKYRIAIGSTSAVTVPLNIVNMTGGSIPDRVVVHANEAGLSTVSDFYMSLGDLPAVGSVALYAPDTSPPVTLDAVSQIIDFVQWGGPNQPNAATAVAAGVWPSVDEYVPAVPATGGYDLAFCGLESERGTKHWKVSQPNFGSQELCATPTRATTWGRVKVLYR